MKTTRLSLPELRQFVVHECNEGKCGVALEWQYVAKGKETV
jgi:hypothetical protein